MATISRNVRLISRLDVPEKQTTYRIKGADGLRLVAYPSGKKVWYSAYQLGAGKSRKQQFVRIGEYSDHPDGWTLDKAIEKNKELQAKASSGIDPQAPTTFGELFKVWLEEHAEKQLKAWEDEERRYGLHLKNPLADKLIADIERKDVREIRDNVLDDLVPSNPIVSLLSSIES